MTYVFTPPTQLDDKTRVLLAANRLEGRPRSPEFTRALRAEVRDAAWLLARQWQLKEFRAEDRGAPAYVETEIDELPLGQVVGPDRAVRPYATSRQPLEAAVEAQPRVIGAGLRLQMGQFWRRQLRTLPSLATSTDPATQADRMQAVGVFALALPLRPYDGISNPVEYAQQASTPEVLTLLELAGSDALDGYALYLALLAPYQDSLQQEGALADSDLLAQRLDGKPLAGNLLAAAPFAGSGVSLAVGSGVQKLRTALGSNLTTLNRAAYEFVLTFHRLYLLGADSSTWSTENLAYNFTVGVAGASGLGEAHYPGGVRLPWYAVDEQPAPDGTPAAPAPPAPRRLLATEVRFPGMMAARWWEFEDQRIDLGRVTGDPADWGRMLLQEFMFLYQNDWFAIPYSVTAGTVCRVRSLRVTDVFGLCYAIQPAGAGQLREPDGTLIDNDAQQWQFLAQTALAPDNTTAPALYLPATALAPLSSPAIESVTFRREEATNLVWAVESIVPDGFAGGTDGSRAANQVRETLRRLATPPAAGAAATGTPAYAYQLVSEVAENWLPFVPVRDSPDAAALLAQGTLTREIPGLTLSATEATVQPRTALLQLHPQVPYLLHEHELPPDGLRIEGRCYRVRWHGGRIVQWLGRHRAPAPVGGSSGLAFDQLLPSS